MTGRATQQADRQRRTLDALGVARRRSPGPGPGALVGVDAIQLALLDSIEHAGNLARLGRATADPADPEADNRWRRLVVLVNTISQAIVDDIRSGDTTAVERLYGKLALHDHQRKET